MSAKDYFGLGGLFYTRHVEVVGRDPEYIKFKKESLHHGNEWSRLREEVEQLEKQKNEAKDEEGRKELEQQVKLKTLERDLAGSKRGKAVSQQIQRSGELEKEMLLKEQITAASDDMQSEIQRLLERAERVIREYKEKVNKFQSDAKSHEESLGLLVKEGTVLLREYTDKVIELIKIY